MHADIPALAHELTSPDVSARRKAAEALARCDPPPSAAAAALARAAADDDEAVREWATSALEDLGPPREADLSELARLVEAAPLDTAYWAATLIGRLESAAAPLAIRLAEVLQTRGEAVVRERSAWALGRMGTAGSAAAPVLESTSRQPNCPPRLARLCRDALQSISPPPGNPSTAHLDAQ